MIKRVNCLYRVSTKGQVDKDDIPMQRQACREYAMQMGWTITHEYYEKGISGFKVSADKRDAIQDLKAAAENHEFEVLLVFMFDRLGRIQNETPFVLEWFAMHGIEVWSTKEGQQAFENDTDYLMNYIRFWQAGGESKKTSLRVKTKLGQMIEEGQFTGGNCPFGYKFVKSGIITKKGRELVKLEMVPEEIALVRYIFEKTVYDGYGTFRLSEEMNRRGIKTHNGARFQPNSINRILKNKIYLGIFERGGKQSPVNESIRIITEKEYDEAQRIIFQRTKEMARKSSIAYTTRGKALLGGNIFCKHCGSKMYGILYTDTYMLASGEKKVKKGIKYCCQNRARKRGECDGMSQYLAKKVDDAVLLIVNKTLEKIKGSAKDEAINAQYENIVKEKKAIYLSLKQKTEKEQAVLNKLVSEVGRALIGESSFTIDVLNASISATKEKLAEYEKQIPQAYKEYTDKNEILEHLDGYYDTFKGWASEFATASRERKKMIICKLIDRIEIGNDYDIRVKMNINYEQFIS